MQNEKSVREFITKMMEHLDKELIPVNNTDVPTALRKLAIRLLEDIDEFVDDESEDDEACPGCGRMPGEDVSPDCFHQLGCGYYKQYEEFDDFSNPER